MYFYTKFEPAKEFEWGVTFSHRYAQYLGLDWRQLYLDMLNDLQPKKLRLMTYWEDIESVRGEYNFSVAAEMLDEAGRRNIEVILVVGHKQPRWPECHHPAWYNDLPQAERDKAQLTMVRNVVNYYKQFDAIKMWQVENEALFSFGYNCPPTDKELVTAQMQIVRELDDRPILLTDSGEFGRWLPTASLQPDVFGSTMYRVVHNPKFGYFKYPLPSQFFRVKAGLFKTFYDIPIIGVELQAEPWFADDMFQTPLETHYALMNPKILEEYAEYARQAGFGQNYLWGVEWWYWLAQKHGDWGMWQAGKNVLNS
jgi:hypothetical protein